MEHQKASGKPISKILKFLPRATSSVSFQNPPVYSPAKDKKPSEKPHKSNLGIGFSGPMVSIVPSDNRRKIKNVNDSTYTLVYEPTSPRVSCMGQVKCKHYRKLAAAAANATNKPANKFSRATSFTPVRSYNKEEDQEKITEVVPVVIKSKKKSGIRSLLRRGAGGSRRKSDETENKSKTALNLQKAPSLGMMKRFSSGRDAFSNFDWTTQVTPLDCAHRNYYTDDERDGGSDGEEIMVPSSAPVMERNKGFCDNFVRVGGVNSEPRKEINLWKRRTMAQPKPLQLHVAN
ncbi:hypothetical protein L1987_61488 [Smallanthus sonchifolius]|uniref:Uncharacterized protein n=1 Tax=Smallanthus sonchifolius TaxID=185202 RepID=A0ACB9C7S3_9ASTR|nr:hypothetical protein L1987_61488 [Smallanthus sonchifolius]